MIRYKRKIRLKDLEIFMLFKDGISMGYLIIEDLRRTLNDDEKQRMPFKIMDEEDLSGYINVIRISILSDEELEQEDRDIFKEFAMDLVDEKDHCLYILDSYVNVNFFLEAPLDFEPKDYQKMLELVDSDYDVLNLNLNNLSYLSQD